MSKLKDTDICPTCRGQGNEGDVHCPTCDGSGEIPAMTTEQPNIVPAPDTELDRILKDFSAGIVCRVCDNRQFYSMGADVVAPIKAAILKNYRSVKDIEAAIGEDEFPIESPDYIHFDRSIRDELRATIRHDLGLE